jgi:dTDP-4-dehydrorhamnose reductase
VLARRLARETEVISTYGTHPFCPEGTRGARLNLDNPDDVRVVLEKYRPETIFHLAAITDPDECERHPARARRVNLEATRELARWASSTGAKLVFASTDLVFDGEKGNYREEDEPAPLGVYGRTKLDAERAVLDTCPGAAVVRGSLFYGVDGPHGRTFLTRLLEVLSKGETMRLFVDQKRNPVLLDDLAEAMVAVAQRDLAGLYHVAGGNVLTRYEFGVMVCEIFGFDTGLLLPIEMAGFGYEARRPMDSSLNIGKFKRETGFEPTPIGRALAGLKSRLIL